MKTISRYCHNKSCQHYDMDLRCHCNIAVKNNDLIYKCKIREQAKVVSRIESVKKSKEKNIAWWNGYQRAFHGSFGKPVDLKVAIGYPYGKMVLVKDCPFCHGMHKHKKGIRIKFTQCAKCYYKIFMSDTK